jgi:tetratricopeptide (TPR) repeat protein
MHSGLASGGCSAWYDSFVLTHPSQIKTLASMVKHDIMTKFFILIGLFFSITLSSCSQTTSEEYLQKGDDLYRQKLYDKAIEQYDKAISKKNDFITPYINKGQALEFQRKFQEAIDNYNALLKISPDQTQALTRRGISYIKIQKFQEALVDLAKANNQDPNNAQILCNIGVCKIRIKDASGIQELNQSILLDASNYEAYYNRGLGKLLLQDNEEAIKDFEKAINLKSDFGEAYFSIGLCKFQLGDKNSACKYWKQSVDKGYSRAQPIIDENCN